MRILLVGAGGVGTAFARIAARRPFAELVIADYDLGLGDSTPRRPATGTRPCSCTPWTSRPSSACSRSTVAMCS